MNRSGVGGRRRWYARVLVVGLGPLAWLVLAAMPAWAHAELTATDPANGAHLDRSPTEIVLRFSQPVTPVAGGVRLLDTRGRQVGPADAGTVPGRPEQVRLPVAAGLPDGYYVLSWRVVSLDSHPVAGALTFSVGAAAGAGPAELPGGGTSRALTIAFWLVRGVGYLTLALLVGGGYFVLICQRDGTDDRSRRLLRAGWYGSIAAAVGALLLQGPYVAGGSLARALDPALLGATLHDNYGLLVAARLGLLVAGWPLLVRLVAARTPAPADPAAPRPSSVQPSSARPSSARPSRAEPAAAEPAGVGRAGAAGPGKAGAAGPGRTSAAGLGKARPGGGLATARLTTARPATAGLVGAGLIAAGLAATWAAGGHARAGADVPVAILADTVHLLAMSVWLGGLVFLVAGVLAPGQPVGAAAAALTRFSRTAMIAVVVLVLTGTFQAWRELVGSGPLTGSPWVGLLVFKVAAFGLLIVLAAGSRALVRSRYLRPVTAAPPRAGRAGRAARRRDQAEQTDAIATLARLRRPVGYEVALAVGVLGLTAALVATSPQPSGLALAAAPAAYAGPYRGAVTLTGGNTVDVWLDPARPGRNELVLNVRKPDGTSLDVPGLDAKLTVPAVDSAAVPIPLRRTGPGQYIARDLAVPAAGVCRLQLHVRTGEFDAATSTLDIAVR
ncbi:MAG TPA: copper resistance protein CopC [Mycobacteriales bacterium]|nr:copper resistance protein CopC [Mycobacteriales bacterium]